jgi:predicted RNA-binding Zn-ribbon protein involved in translation (DUF1610 family)
MVVCPSCGSSRIRGDYKPAPFVLRVIGVRALLCDYCNRQFRAFSPAPPRTRVASRNTTRKLDGAQPTTRLIDQNYIDPNREQIRLALEASRLFLSIESNQEQQIKLDLTGFASINDSPLLNGNGNGNGNGYVAPVHPDMRSEIARLHDAQSMKETQGLNGIREKQKTNTTCPECGSNWVRRRQRSGLERVVFALTNHKAFICRSCDASFYARTADEREASNIMESSRSA